jgi:hypothetical protein
LGHYQHLIGSDVYFQSNFEISATVASQLEDELSSRGVKYFGVFVINLLLDSPLAAPSMSTTPHLELPRTAPPVPTDHPAGAVSSLPVISTLQATTPYAAWLAAAHLAVLATEIGLWWGSDSVQLLAMGNAGGLLVGCSVRRSPSHMKGTASVFFL